MMSCEQHDYIEIACLYRYSVILTLKSGEIISGIAFDTTRDQHRQECIQILVDDTVKIVPLAEINCMKSTKPNPYFNRIDFN